MVEGILILVSRLDELVLVDPAHQADQVGDRGVRLFQTLETKWDQQSD